MTICTQTVELDRLEMLDVTDELFADSLRRCPVTQVKKTYQRVESLPRILTLTGGVCCPTHDYSDDTNTLSGYFVFPADQAAAALDAHDALVGPWVYVLLVTPNDALNWLGAIKIASVQNVEIEGSIMTRINVQPLYRRIVSGVWVVSESPFEEV